MSSNGQQPAAPRHEQHVEIERKFLVTEPPGDLGRCEASDIAQGYLALTADGTEVRVRMRDGDATLTIKQGSGRVRAEEEVELDREAFERLWPLTQERRIEKRRHLVPIESGLTVEVDVYTGDLEGLVLAEVEFAEERDAEGFDPPPWLGEELTGDPRYSSQRLAVDGIPG